MTFFNIHHITAVVRKEFYELYRDPRYVGFAIILPIVLLFLFGYAMTLDVDEVRFAYIDYDKTTLSRRYIDRFANSRYFLSVAVFNSRQEIESQLEKSNIRLGIVIPADFSRKIYALRASEVEFIVDGTWPNMANIIIGYVHGVNSAFNQHLLEGLILRLDPQSAKRPLVMEVEPRIWFNEDLDSINFIIPGLFAVILMSFPPILAALAIVKEKEQGSIEQIYMSPISPESFIIGKLVPQATIAFIDLILVVLIGIIWFKVPFLGDPFLFFFLGGIYCVCTCGMGLLISTITRTQVAAMIVAIVIAMMPAFLFTGFFFPISNMPKALAFYSYFFPGRFFMAISRGIIVKGIHLGLLYSQVFGLVVYTFIIYSIAFYALRKRL